MPKLSQTTWQRWKKNYETFEAVFWATSQVNYHSDNNGCSRVYSLIPEFWHAMMLRHLVVCLAVGAGHGWWRTDDPKEEGPWRGWAAEKFPTAIEYLDYVQERTASSRQTVVQWSETISERGLWVVFDGIAGLFGWAFCLGRHGTMSSPDFARRFSWRSWSFCV